MGVATIILIPLHPHKTHHHHHYVNQTRRAPYDVHALGDVPEHTMFAIQPCGLDGAEEELGAVGVWSGVGHGEHTRAGVLQHEVLIRELSAVDGFAARAVVVGEITALAHELGNHPVEGRTLEPESLLARAQGAEVFWGGGEEGGCQY